MKFRPLPSTTPKTLLRQMIGFKRSIRSWISSMPEEGTEFFWQPTNSLEQQEIRGITVAMPQKTPRISPGRNSRKPSVNTIFRKG